MIALAALAVALTTDAAPPPAPSVEPTGAVVVASAAPASRLDDGGGVLRTAPTSPRLRRARRGTRSLRIPVPRRQARIPAHRDDLAHGLGHADAAALGVRTRDALARRVALRLLRSRLSPRSTRRGTPPRAA